MVFFFRSFSTKRKSVDVLRENWTDSCWEPQVCACQKHSSKFTEQKLWRDCYDGNDLGNLNHGSEDQCCLVSFSWRRSPSGVLRGTPTLLTTTVIFVSPASNLQNSETSPCRMLLAKVCFLWHLDDFSISTMYSHTVGNRSSRPNVISPEVMALDTGVTSPAIYLCPPKFHKMLYTHFIQREVAKVERSRVRIVCRSLKPWWDETDTIIFN